MQKFVMLACVLYTLYSFCVSFYCNIPTYAHYCIYALLHRACIGIALLVTK